jgi:hypothetical protein
MMMGTSRIRVLSRVVRGFLRDKGFGEDFPELAYLGPVSYTMPL